MIRDLLNRKRRILVNVLLAFVLLPITKNAPMFFDVVVLGNEMPYHLAMDYWRYMEMFMMENFLILPMGYLIIVLVPYNLALLSNAIHPKFIYKKNYVKIIIMTVSHLLGICIVGSITNIWYGPIWHNTIYIGIALLYSSIMAPIIHFAVDKREIREMKKMTS